MENLPLSTNFEFPVMYLSNFLGTVIFPGFWEMKPKDQPNYDDQSEAIIDWCKENNWFFYEVPGEDFNEYVAITRAIANKSVGVLVNSLS